MILKVLIIVDIWLDIRDLNNTKHAISKKKKKDDWNDWD